MADVASDDLVGRLAAAEAERDKIREKLHNAVRARALPTQTHGASGKCSIYSRQHDLHTRHLPCERACAQSVLVTWMLHCA